MNLLLHICCGPCAAYPTRDLLIKNVDFTGMYFNPNIHPYDEFVRRRENLEKLSVNREFDVIYFNDFDQSSWEHFKGETEERCRMCYTVRFEKLAQEAVSRGFDAFGTTLLVSPYQKHDMIIEICRRLAEKYSIEFYYQDWREGFRKGQEMAKEMGLYRQKYCGCIKSDGHLRRNGDRV